MKTRFLIIIVIAIVASSAGVSITWMEYGSVCNKPVTDHLQKHSNLFDENTTHETYGILEIGYPFGVHSWNVKQCVDHVLEQRELEKK